MKCLHNLPKMIYFVARQVPAVKLRECELFGIFSLRTHLTDGDRQDAVHVNVEPQFDFDLTCFCGTQITDFDSFNQ